MPSSRRQKTKAKPPAKRPAKSRPAAAKKPTRTAPRPATKKPAHPPAPKAIAKPAKPAVKASGKAGAKSKEPQPELEVPLPDGRKHVLSLSFVRDGDEFLARLETDVGHITELKNRSLDQLLTLVASELEDLLE